MTPYFISWSHYRRFWRESLARLDDYLRRLQSARTKTRQ